jgi:hypothetical protein
MTMEDFSTVAIAIAAFAALSSAASALITLSRQWLQRRRPSVTIKLPDGRTIDLSQTLPPEKVDEIVSEVSRSNRVPDSGTTRKS